MHNIIFDVGNVLLTWQPLKIIRQVFPEHKNPELLMPICKDIWQQLDAGSIDSSEAKVMLQDKLQTTKDTIENLFAVFKSSLIPVPGSFELLEKLSQSPHNLYCLTNMALETFDFLRQKYDFWDKFKGIVVSAKIKLVKPDPKIYTYTLNKFNLSPQKTVFIDDMLENILAARELGITGIHFTDVAACKEELKSLGLY